MTDETQTRPVEACWQFAAVYGKPVADETARWKQVVEAAGIPPQQ